MIKAIVLIVALISLFVLIGTGLNAIDKRAYARGKADANQLAGEAITLQNQQMASLATKHRKERRIYEQRLTKEQREYDAKITKLLNEISDFKQQWNLVLHGCVVAIFYGVRNDACPSLDM